MTVRCVDNVGHELLKMGLKHVVRNCGIDLMMSGNGVIMKVVDYTVKLMET